ncbi:Protein lethal(2)denticleless [Blattella germanica]|nr:Protein lethal(2)denticleless [Blattella germanica]
MDFAKSLYNREIGRRTVTNYDSAIKRLKCYNYNEYYGIYPNTPGQMYNPDSPAFACEFCCKSGYQHWLALANEDGMIAIQDTTIKRKHSPLEEIYAEGTQAHHNAIFDLAWMEGELKLVSVSGDHTAVLWDVSNMPFRQLHRFKGHTRSVKTVAFRPEDKGVFATGARDGVIMIWDTRSNQGPMWDKPDNYISNSHHPSGPGTPTNGTSKCRKSKCTTPTSRANSITGLVFQDQYCLISCGAGDGLIKVWDLRKNYSAYKREPMPCHTLPYPGNTTRNGFTNLVLDPGKIRLYASCIDSVIYCYNVATYESKPVSFFVGHTNSTFYVKSCLSPDGVYLASGSSDEHAYIWNTNGESTPVACLTGHGAEVTSVQWCPVGDTKIVTCSDDARHRIWEVGLEFEGENDAVELRGWAKIPTINPELAITTKEAIKMTNVTVETTPRAIKLRVSRQEGTPESIGSNTPPSGSVQPVCRDCKGKDQTPCSVCQLQNGNSRKKNMRGSKRRLTDYMDEGSDIKRPVLSPVREENQESKVITESRGPRRLFSPHKSPSRVSQLPVESASSPTLNLPNYVLDGSSPHHHCSPNNRLKENVDWLTKLRKERTTGERSTSPSVTPKRRLTRSRSHDLGKGSSPKGNPDTLLRFFRVSGKPSGETWNCSTSQTESSPVVPTVEP